MFFTALKSDGRGLGRNIPGLMLVLFLLACGSLAGAADYYVDDSNANPTPDGSIGNPYTTIAAAFAVAGNGGDTIHVAQGSYPEKIIIPADFTKRYLTFLGGYQDGSNFATRDPWAYPSIIGTAAGAIEFIGYGNNERANTFDGFKITGASTDYAVDIMVVDSVIIRNCEITGNTDGGFYLQQVGDLLIEDCKIYGNSNDTDGGAMYIWPRVTTNVDPIIRGCEIYNNVSATNGEAVYVREPNNLVDPLTFEDCVIRDHTDGGSAVYVGYYLTTSRGLKFLDCVFRDNDAGVDHGAAIRFGAFGLDGALIENCQFINNKANRGGAIYKDGLAGRPANLDIIDSDFIGNSATDRGGAIMIYRDGVDHVVNISNSNFAGNSANSGGCIELWPQSDLAITIDDSVFVGNQATNSAVFFCTNYTAGSLDFQARNSIFAYNVASNITSVLHMDSRTAGDSAVLENCTFRANQNAGSYAGAIRSRGLAPVLNNCLFSQDVANTDDDRNKVLANDVDGMKFNHALFDLHPSVVRAIRDRAFPLTAAYYDTSTDKNLYEPVDPLLVMDGANATTGTWTAENEDSAANTITLTDGSASWTADALIGQIIVANRASLAAGLAGVDDRRGAGYVLDNTTTQVTISGQLVDYLNSGDTSLVGKEYAFLDVQLEMGSSAIDAGLTTPSVTVDIQGVSRGFDGDSAPDSPEPGDYDIGAYEFFDADPTVVIATRDAGPTNADTVIYDVTFSEDVTSVTAAAFDVVTVSGDAIGVKAFDSISSSAYTVTVNNITGDGELRVDLVDISEIEDSFGNQLAATAQGDVTVVDNTAPALLTLRVQSDQSLEIVLDESVSLGVVPSNFTVSGTGQGTLAANPDSVTPGGSDNYHLNWSSGALAGGEIVTLTLAAAVQDAAGNAVTPNSASVGTLNEAPYFSSTPLTGVQGQATQVYADDISASATDPEGGDVAYILMSGPAWLNLNSTGTLSGTPDASDTGVNEFTVRAVDARGLYAEATLLILVDPVSAASGQDLYVDASNSDSSPDGSISNPFPTINEAFALAGNQGDVIHVAAGTYNEQVVFPANNQKDYLSILGGYATGGDFSERDPWTNTTTIQYTSATIQLQTAERDYYALIDGFRLTGSSTEPTLRLEGAGNFTLRNLEVTGNTGGGIYMTRTSDSVLEDSKIHGNDNQMAGNAGNGGGLFIWPRKVEINGPIVRRCDIYNNTAAANGAGVWIRECRNTTSPLLFVDTTFRDHTDDNGAVWAGYGAPDQSPLVGLKFLDCEFRNNVSTSLPGGAFSNTASVSDIVFEGTTFINNTTVNRGGAISFDCDVTEGGLITLIDCDFIGNEATDAGAVVAQRDNASIVVEGSRFTGNRASDRSAVFFANNITWSLSLKDSWFVGNEAEKSSIIGLAGPNNEFGFEAVNCVFAYNRGIYSADYNAAGLFNLRPPVGWTNDPVFDNCTFRANQAGGTVAFLTRYGSVAFNNCLFSQNVASTGDNRNQCLINYTNTPVASEVKLNHSLFDFHPSMDHGIRDQAWPLAATYYDTTGDQNVYEPVDPMLTMDGDDATTGSWTGESENASSKTLTLTDANAEFVPGSLIGKYLVPNTADLATGAASIDDSRMGGIVLDNGTDWVTINGVLADYLDNGESSLVGKTWALMELDIAQASPAADAGWTTTAAMSDIEGTTRGVDANGTADDPVVGDYDIGAFEWAENLTAVPVIVTQPTSLELDEGEVASFAISAIGEGVLSYQWYRGETAITDSSKVSGAQSATLTIDPVGGQDTGWYYCAVTNAAGEVISNAAGLTVIVLEPASVGTNWLFYE